MKIGLIQQHNTGDREDNKARLAEKIGQLAKKGAELIVLQELHNGLYFCQIEDVNLFDQAEPIPGPSTEFFGQFSSHRATWDSTPSRPLWENWGYWCAGTSGIPRLPD